MKSPYLTEFLIKAMLTIPVLFSGACQNTLSNDMPATSKYLVGSYAEAGNPAIYSFNLDQQTGAIIGLNTIVQTENPSYLAWSAETNTLFAVNETANGGISRFDRREAELRFELSATRQGLSHSPCYISISPDGSMLAIANYVSSDIHLFKIDGELLTVIDHVKLQGSGPHQRQQAPHPHWADWSPEGDFLYVVDLGADRIMAYKTTNGDLANGTIAASLQAGDGPRHMAIHPTKKLAYVINELSNTIVVFERNPTTGTLTAVQRVSAITDSYSGISQGAAIKLSADQEFLYVSNRGPNSITVFKLDGHGKLAFLQEQATGGDWPRDFTFSADGRFVLVANERSNSITVLQRDLESGLLSATPHLIEVSKPTFLTELN